MRLKLSFGIFEGLVALGFITPCQALRITAKQLASPADLASPARLDADIDDPIETNLAEESRWHVIVDRRLLQNLTVSFLFLFLAMTCDVMSHSRCSALLHGERAALDLIRLATVWKNMYAVARRRHKSGLLTTVIPSFDSVKSPVDYPPVSPCQASCNRERQGILLTEHGMS